MNYCQRDATSEPDMQPVGEDERTDEVDSTSDAVDTPQNTDNMLPAVDNLLQAVLNQTFDTVEIAVAAIGKLGVSHNDFRGLVQWKSHGGKMVVVLRYVSYCWFACHVNNFLVFHTAVNLRTLYFIR